MAETSGASILVLAVFANALATMGHRPTVGSSHLQTSVISVHETSDGRTLSMLENSIDELAEKSHDDLVQEVQRLRRKIYLMQVRKGGMDLKGHMGNAIYFKDDYDSRWKGAYPESLQAKYCMTGTAKFVAGDCEYANGAPETWKPQISSAPESLDIVKMAAPYVDRQMPRGVFEVMKMVPQARPYWDMATLRKMYEIIDAQGDVSPIDYPKAHLDVQGAIDHVGGLVGKTVLVAGSISPWIESIALRNGASNVTTVDYSAPMLSKDVRSEEPRLNVRQMDELLDSGDHFDVVLSYSSIEHDGLGRYGDPLNPEGDFAAMKEIFQMLAPSGKLLLGVPASRRDYLAYNSQRVYGPVRLPLLLQGWKYEGSVQLGQLIKRFDMESEARGVLDEHTMLILSKPRQSASFLEENYGREECALHCNEQKETDTSACFPQDQDGKAC